MASTNTLPLSQLTPAGVQAAKAYLADLRDGQVDTPFPEGLLTAAPFAEVIEPTVLVADRDFASRRAAGQYLSECLHLLPLEKAVSNAGLWSWLGMFYFDRLVGRDESGQPRLGRDADVAYLLDPVKKSRGENRHRLRLAYETYARHGEKAWFMLNQPVMAMEQLAERLSGKPIAFRSTGIVQLAHLLYADPATGQTRRGYGGGGQDQRRSGNLMRFIDVLDQLYMTYDVYGMTAEELLKLLPAEFAAWRPGG